MKRFEVALKKFLLSLFLGFYKHRRNNSEPRFSKNSKILFIRLNRIGDALVTTPLIYEVKKQIQCKTYILADSKNHFVFQKFLADEVIVFEKGIINFFTLLKKLNSLQLDAVVDTHDDVSTTVTFMIRYLKAPFKIALEKQNHSVFTHTVKKLDPVNNHVVDRILELGKLLGIEIDNNNNNIQYFPSGQSMGKAIKFVNTHFPEKKFLLGINISAGSEARFWGVSKFKKIMEFCNKLPIDVLLLSTTRDLHHAFQITLEKKKIFYTPSFDEFAAIVSQVDLLFSPDTATIHLASIHKKPVFGVYVQYNTDDMVWSPYRSDFDCVVTKEPTLDNVEFDKVISKFEPFLLKHINSKQ